MCAGCAQLFFSSEELNAVPAVAEGYEPTYASAGLRPSHRLRNFSASDTAAQFYSTLNVSTATRSYRVFVVYGDGVAVVTRGADGTLIESTFIQIAGVVDYRRSGDKLFVYALGGELLMDFRSNELNIASTWRTEQDYDPYNPVRLISRRDDPASLKPIYISCLNLDSVQILRWEPATLSEPECQIY